MELCRRVSLLCALAVFVLAVGGAGGQVRCYRESDDCTGTNFFNAASVAECCLSDEGMFVEVGGTCETCIVFGWITGNLASNTRRSITFPESGERELLTVGYSKGIPEDDSYDIMLRGTVTEGGEGMATQGATADFRLEGSISSIVISYIRVGNIGTGGPTTDVPAIIQIDNVALEPDEDFILSFEVVSPTSPDNLLTGSTAFIVDELQVFIEDQTEFTVQFGEFDYSQDENRGSLPVAVLINAELASDLQLRVVTRNLTQVYTPLTDGDDPRPVITLPEGFSELATFVSDVPYIASSVDGDVATVDYYTSTQVITFTAGPAASRTVQAPVAVFNDDIDEAEEEYFLLFLETDEPRVDLTNGRFASRGIIRDDDTTTIGFQFPDYSYEENRTNPFVTDVFIIKEGNTLSELTFTITVLIATGTGTGSAVVDPNDDDRDIVVPSIEYTNELRPDDDKINVPFQIINDMILEGEETFQFSITRADISPNFQTSREQTRIFIKDDESVVIGFERTEFTVSEDTGLVELCLVIDPALDIGNKLYRVGVETVEGTATNEDYEQRSASDSLFFANTLRRQCVNVTIRQDNLFERSESFRVRARENPPSFDDVQELILEPDVASITIVDQDTFAVRIGFVRTEEIVEESIGEVTIGVMWFNSNSPLPDVNISVRVFTDDGTATAGSDYTPIDTILTFTPSNTLQEVQLQIIDDNVLEDTETLTALLELSSAPSNVVVTLDPDLEEISIMDIAVLEVNDEEVPENIGSVVVKIENIGYNNSVVSFSVMTREYTGDGATATADKDYRNLDLTPVVLHQGDVSAEVTVTIIDDDLLEQTEQFEVVIVEATNAKLQKPVGVITIIDDDTDTSSLVSVETIAVAVTAVVALAAFVIAASMTVFYCRQRRMKRELSVRTDERSGNDIPMAECTAYGEVKVQEDDYQHEYEEIPT